MKIYILVAKDKDGKPTINMPVQFGRALRGYTQKGRAQVYGRKFNSTVLEFDTEQGKIV